MVYREVRREAFTGEFIGWVLSCEMGSFQGADLVPLKRRQY